MMGNGSGNGNGSPKVALVVGAGAIKCAAAIGVQKVLEDAGIGADLVVGCSGGAMFAALIALGYDAAQAEKLVMQMWTSEVTRRHDRKAMLRALLPKLFRFDSSWGMIDDTLITDRFNKVYGDRTFADTKVPFHVVAADFENGEKVVLSEGRLADAIRASIAIPFVFKPWRIGERLLIDGSLADPMPVDVAIRENATVILAIGFDNPYQRRVNSPVRFAFQVTTVMTNNLLRANYAFHNLAHHSELILILPEFDGRVNAFDTARLPHIIERGARAMEEQLPYVKQVLAAAA
jgi:NTE family protein